MWLKWNFDNVQQEIGFGCVSEYEHLENVWIPSPNVGSKRWNARLIPLVPPTSVSPGCPTSKLKFARRCSKSTMRASCRRSDAAKSVSSPLLIICRASLPKIRKGSSFFCASFEVSNLQGAHSQCTTWNGYAADRVHSWDIMHAFLAVFSRVEIPFNAEKNTCSLGIVHQHFHRRATCSHNFCGAGNVITFVCCSCKLSPRLKGGKAGWEIGSARSQLPRLIWFQKETGNLTGNSPQANNWRKYNWASVDGAKFPVVQ